MLVYTFYISYVRQKADLNLGQSASISLWTTCSTIYATSCSVTGGTVFVIKTGTKGGFSANIGYAFITPTPRG